MAKTELRELLDRLHDRRIECNKVDEQQIRTEKDKTKRRELLDRINDMSVKFNKLGKSIEIIKSLVDEEYIGKVSYADTILDEIAHKLSDLFMDSRFSGTSSDMIIQELFCKVTNIITISKLNQL